MVIAIDGPGGVGKSTVARAVAAELGLEHLDTGATYRAATLAALRAGADTSDEEAVVDAISRARIGYEHGVIFLDGDPVPGAVRSAEVTAAVSAVSAIADVRDLIVEIQRQWVRRRGGSAVVEGRDIGTVVFPDAAVKVFLTARTDVRAARRATDVEAAGRNVADIAAELAERDRHDSTREVSPLVPAEGATVIDTSDLQIEEVVAKVMTLVSDRA